MDFRLKKLKAGRHGMNMGLRAGDYEGKRSYDVTVGISEDLFWFLEPGIKKHCDRYSSDAHYGETAIARTEWLLILDEWDEFREKLVAASLTTDTPTLRSVPRYARREFVSDFHRNCVKLSKLIGQVDAWIREELRMHEHISILGI